MSQRGVGVVGSACAAGLVALWLACAAGCGGDTADGSTRANNPNSANPASIGPSGATGPSPRDMPGRGRGSEGPHGR
jgi:hypothetical protein